MRRGFLSTAILIAMPALAAVDFQKQVAPILEANCLGCHGPSKALGGLRLDTKPKDTAKLSRLPVVMELPSGKPGAMPPAGPQVPKAQRDLVRQWIEEGAQWPEGFTIRVNKAAQSETAERAAVAKLHARITAGTTPAEMQPYKTTVPGTDISFSMVPIPGGEFVMGTPEAEADRSKDEGPQHQVKISPFWMGKYEVTWDEYRLFMFAQQAGETTGKDEVVDALSRPTRPYVEMSFGMGINGYPAISMTQHAANKFAEWLSAKTGQFYRLPTEAEWEYACRAGTTTAYSFGSDASKLGEYAWFEGNSNGKYEKVGTKKPNPWGLYDMHGNATEWTLDKYAPYTADPAVDPWVKSTKPYPQAVRGGSWSDTADRLRCGARLGSDASWKMQDPQLPKSIWYLTDAQFLGFRLVRPLKVPSVQQMYQYWNNGVEKE
jgi:formylglycine-generating enzyme required for sulfatase activity